MPTLVTFSVVLLFGAPVTDPPGTAAQDDPVGITWSPSPEAARAASRQDGKPLLLYFTYET